VRTGACPCGTVGYTIRGPVRDVIVCYCDECQKATGGPWAATAARRDDLVVSGEAALDWEHAAVSEHNALRARCQRCETVVFWDAPGRETVSVAVSTLSDAAGLHVAALIWSAATAEQETVYPAGLPATVTVPWRD
jgi:hypothetical protein